MPAKAEPLTENRPGRPSQIPLVSAIAEELKRQGFPFADPRQMNAVVKAADLICEEFGKPHTIAPPESGLVAWAESDDTGMSSEALAMALWPDDLPWKGRPRVRPTREATAYPHDPSDFGRCVRMLASEPGLRERLPLARGMSPVWARLVDAWDELEAMYREELPSGKAPKLYRRMREIIGNE